MTVEAVPRTARMTITRIIQAGTGANQSRTSVRTVVNEGLGVAKAGNACTAIRWVAGRLLSQYLLSIVFMDSLPRPALFRTLHNFGKPRPVPTSWLTLKMKSTPILADSVPRTIGQEAKSCRPASRYALRPPALSTDPQGRQPSPHSHA